MGHAVHIVTALLTEIRKGFTQDNDLTLCSCCWELVVGSEICPVREDISFMNARHVSKLLGLWRNS
jgi:hypothetical protein